MTDLLASEPTPDLEQEIETILNNASSQEDVRRAMADLAAKGGHPIGVIQRVLEAKANNNMRELRVAQKDIRERLIELDRKTAILECFKGLHEWLLLSSDQVHIQKNEHSRVHRLFEAAMDGRVNLSSGASFIFSQQSMQSAKVFVVRHDWAAAIGPAIDEVLDSADPLSLLADTTQCIGAQATEGLGSDDADVGGTDAGKSDLSDHSVFNLPFDHCAFEFLVEGRCAIMYVTQSPGERPQASWFVDYGERWCALSKDQLQGTCGVFEFMWRQVLAICVALDAGVAAHSVVTAPAALNKKRAKSGRPPLVDFHVIDLARRLMRAEHSGGSESAGSKRLHFRRGHWRHFIDRRKWIKWMLVGNPDLGFVDKLYRL